MVRRVPMAATAAFAALFLAAFALAPLTPGIDRPGDDVVGHFTAHAGAIRVQALLTALAMAALVVVLAHARDRFDGPALFVFTVATAVLVTEVNLQLWFTAGLSLHADDLDAATARTVVDIAAMWAPVLAVANVLVAGSVVWAARHGRFPRWLGVIAGAFAVEQFLETVTFVGPAGSFIAPGGPMNMVVGAALFGIFFCSLGIAVALTDEQAAVCSPTTGRDV